MTTRWTGIAARLCVLGALSALPLVSAGCGPGGDSEQDTRELDAREGTVQAPLTTQFTYNASNTNSATQNTTTGLIYLTAGQTVTVGTCGVSGASFLGDTYLRFNSPTGAQVAANDDACGGVGSSFSYTVPVGAGGNYQVVAGCYSSGSCGGTVAWTISGGTTPPPPPPPADGPFFYSASNTSSGTANTTNRIIRLTAGQTLTLGTCGVTGASYSGDTLLRFYNPAGTEVTSSDDACGGTGSNFTYTVPAGAGGDYQVRAGCYGSNSCSGNVAWTISSGTTTPADGPFSYSASYTNNATANTTNRLIRLTEGQTVIVGTCGVTGASYSGDTYLRLFNPAGVEVTSSDNSCGGVGSNLSYTIPAGAGGDYQVRAGCYSSGSCSGTVAWTTNIPPPPPPPPGTTLDYTAADTSDASVNTVNQTFSLTAGQAIAVGTCGVPGSSSSGDTLLRLFGPAGTQVVASTHACAGSTGSYLAYTVPAGAAGDYQLRAGCSSSSACGGTVAWHITTPPAPSGNYLHFSSSTSTSTGQTLYLTAGQTIIAGSCGVASASFLGDTVVRLYRESTRTDVIQSNDACGGIGSNLAYTIPPDGGGTYQIRVGCAAGTSCGATLVWTIR